MLNFKGSKCLQLRLILSILSGREIEINNIRMKGESIGLSDFEIDLLKLIMKVTNGTVYKINETGVQLIFKPGTLIGGKIEHDCCLQRSMSYYLQALMFLAPFCKQPVDATLTGVTNDMADLSIDSFKLAAVPMLNKILGRPEVELKVVSRGFPPNGGGKIQFKSPIRIYYGAIKQLSVHKVKRVRGIAIASRVSPEFANRLIRTAKGLLLEYIPDVYIYSEHMKGASSGRSPGYGMALCAETTDGVFYVGESFYHALSSDEPGASRPSAEEIAEKAVYQLFQDIYRGGCCSSQYTPLMTLSMALCQADVSKVLLGTFSPYTHEMFRHLREFFSITFKLEWQDETEEGKAALQLGSRKILATCVGIGFKTVKTII